MTYHLVFDKFPSPEGSRFIELEDSNGRSISAGEWKQRKDGYVELVLPAPMSRENLCFIYNTLSDLEEKTPSVLSSMEILNEAVDAAATGWQDIATALRTLSRVHLREDDIAGFNVLMGAKPDWGNFVSNEEYILAWECVWNFLNPPKPLSYEGEQMDPLQLKWKNQFSGKGE